MGRYLLVLGSRTWCNFLGPMSWLRRSGELDPVWVHQL
jgi:hypothetical protein